MGVVFSLNFRYEDAKLFVNCVKFEAYENLDLNLNFVPVFAKI